MMASVDSVGVGMTSSSKLYVVYFFTFDYGLFFLVKMKIDKNRLVRLRAEFGK